MFFLAIPISSKFSPQNKKINKILNKFSKPKKKGGKKK
jgi:hypothetical protein